jgi:hypothetical protein
MKKVNLKKLFAGAELLSRAELKKVVGGGALNCSQVGSLCFMSEECCEGLNCVDGQCVVGDSQCPDTCGGTLPACPAGQNCIPHGVYQCSNKPLGCYIPGW